MNIINLLGQDHEVLSAIQINISDSFVDRSVKTRSGNGETRLYISNQASSVNGRFFEFDMQNTIEVYNQKNQSNYYHPCIYKGFFIRDNLIKYMQDAFSDYMFPRFKYNQPIQHQYESKLSQIYSLPPIIEFTIHKQDGSMDVDRFYIGSGCDIWHQVRSYVLPFISKYIIYKVHNLLNNQVSYFFQLVHNSNLEDNIYTEETTEALSLDSIQNNTTITCTEKQSLILSRRGQGVFRNNCLSILSHCPFTYISNPAVLRASHIIPWSKCQNNLDRLNGFNGLMLSPFYDVLFDKGFISFEDDGRLLISSLVTPDIIHHLNLIPNTIINLNNVNGQRNIYLNYHRNYIFKK